MDIIRLFFDYFGISLLTENATVVDFINMFIPAFFGAFFVCFALRSLVLMFCDRR